MENYYSTNMTSEDRRSNSSRSYDDTALQGIVSDAVLNMAVLINGSVLLCLSIFGLVNNTIIIVVFLKIGFKETINISLVCLALTDFLTMLPLLGGCFSTHPYRDHFGIPVVFLDISTDYLANCGTCFKRTSNYITTYVAFERCLCIVMPLKVKTVITRNRTIFIMATIYTVSISFMMPTFFTYYTTPVFNPSMNKSVLKLFTHDGWDIIYSIDYIFNYFGGACWYALIITSTAVLIRSLRRKQDWRKSATHQPSEEGKQSKVESKDRNAIAMVTFISSVTIVTTIPQWLMTVGTFIDSGFDTFERYHNLYMVVGGFMLYFNCFNASMNVFIYFKMSSKFRATLQAMVSTGH